MEVKQNQKENRQEYMKQYRREHRAQHREYCRQWRSDHPDKVATYNARYWAKKAAQAAAAQDVQDQDSPATGE